MHLRLKQIIRKPVLKYLHFSAFCFISVTAFGQLTVSTALAPQQLVQNVLVGSGVTVTNVTYSGAGSTIGSFTTGSTPTNLGMSSGIVMSTGFVDGSNGTFPIGSTSSNFNSGLTGTGSDPQLASLVSGATIEDAATLQFDFTPLSDTIKFKYVFASEEYPEFVGLGFNDAFGFFVTGPNPAGGNYTNKNIALIPNTNTPVTIDNVNSGSYSQYYVDNTYGTTIVYDGFTTVLTAWCKVIPCLTYHLKLAIGDAGDDAYDSSVFLEENSFSSNAVSVATTYTTTLDTMAIEGCSDAIVNFALQNAPTTPYVIYYTIGGTATNGVDYTTIPDSVIIPVGQTSASVTIHPYFDGITEGNENVTLTVQTSVCGNVQTYTVWIKDNLPVVATAAGDTTICGGQAILTSAGSGGISPYTFQWNNGGCSNSTDIVSPTSTTNYIVTVSDACGSTAADSALVTVGFGSANAGNDTTICPGTTATLVGSGGAGYQWSNNVITAVNLVSPTQTTTYYLTVSGTCNGYDTVTVFIYPRPPITATTSPDSICKGGSVTLGAAGGTSFTWSSSPADPSLSGQENNINPVVSPAQTTIYTVFGTDTNTCSNTSSVSVRVLPLPVASFSINPNAVCIGQNTTITFSGSASANANYTWNFSGGNASGSGQGPYQVNWPNPGVETVSLSIIDDGCPSQVYTDSLTINPVPIALFYATHTSGCAPLTVYFADSSLNVNPATVYAWDFGDQTISAMPDTVHTYVNPGVYSASLTITNGNTCTSTYSLIHPVVALLELPELDPFVVYAYYFLLY